ncbi:MAG: SRPBCC domain-containing protein [Chloroflexota bacterium]
MKKSIRKQKFYAASPSAVWAALTEPQALAQWFMPGDFRPEIGYRFRFQDQPRGKWDGVLTGKVVAVTHLTLLEYTWTGNQMNSITQVKWELAQQRNGTLVKLEHTGFEGVGDILIGFFHQLGWNKYLNQLSIHLAGNV